MTPTDDKVLQATRCWIETWVIGENLCPFAARPWKTGQVRIQLSTADNDEALYHDFLFELEHLLSSNDDAIATTLLVTLHHLHDFEDYLDFLTIAQQALEEAGLEGTLQLASFHPDYLFEGEPADAPSHFTNRSPYPMLHLIREAQVEAAIESHPDAEGIPDTNIKHLESLGIDGIMSLLAPCGGHPETP